MAILTAENILDKFAERLQDSNAVDIAVAWATHGLHIEKLRAFCKREGKLKLRIVVGIDGNATDPPTLRDLAEFANLRIGVARRPASKTFHPKYFCFHKSSESTLWIGSANLTNSAFGRNEELMLETKGTNDSKEWFDTLWNSLSANPQNKIDEYAKCWKPHFDGARSRPENSQISRPHLKPLSNRLDSSWSWNDFVDALYIKHEVMLSDQTDDRDTEQYVPFSVFGDHRSWMHTIRLGHPITMLHSWRNLDRWQKEILVGDTPFGAFGHFKGAGKANGYIKRDDQETRSVRKRILNYLPSASEVEDDPIRIGLRALRGMRKINGIGAGVATRFLALARPESYVSLNNASRIGLAESSGIAPTTLDKHYKELLEWVHGSEWYNAPRPSDSLEAEIWDYRAALVDALVYE